MHLAAFQFSNILFSVPQLSIRYNNITEDHKKMIRHFTDYWVKNKDIFLNENFIGHHPFSNYPILESSLANKRIVGLYSDVVVQLDNRYQNIDIINGKYSSTVVIDCKESLESVEISIVDCMGNIHSNQRLDSLSGLIKFEVPTNGILFIHQ